MATKSFENFRKFSESFRRMSGAASFHRGGHRYAAGRRRARSRPRKRGWRRPTLSQGWTVCRSPLGRTTQKARPAKPGTHVPASASGDRVHRRLRGGRPQAGGGGGAFSIPRSRRLKRRWRRPGLGHGMDCLSPPLPKVMFRAIKQIILIERTRRILRSF
jgi:hypothetical protein